MVLQLSSITREEKGSKAQADLWARVLRAVYRYAYDSYRDKDDGRLLPDPPTTILCTKRLWNGNTRRTTKIRNNDLGRWLKALDTVRQWAIAGYKTDVLMGGKPNRTEMYAKNVTLWF